MLRTTHPMRLLIVEWHPVLTAELREALRREPALQTIGQVTTALEATRLARTLEPNVVLCEATLPDPGAVELARFFRVRMPGTVVVFMTPNASQEELFEAARVGAAAYLRVTSDTRGFISTLLRAANGEFPIDEEVVRHPAVASRILAQFRLPAAQVTTPAPAPAAAPPPPTPNPSRPGSPRSLAPLFVPLSAREIEILDLVARGNSNKLIARQLQISDQTVKNHVSAILRKLEVNDRTEAVVYAIRSGWIRLDSTTPANR